MITILLRIILLGVLTIGIAWSNVFAQFKSFQKISDTAGGFTGQLDNVDDFGESVESLGDLDGDGVNDVAISAEDDDDGGTDRGAVWILFLNRDGTVKAHQKISDTQGGFTGKLDDDDEFGNWVTNVGDLDGDGVIDIAVNAIHDDDGGSNRGAIWILFLNRDGTVKAHQKISSKTGGFTGQLDNNDHFGSSLEGLGDFDGDGIADLAAGAQNDDDGGKNRGAVWLLFLNPNGTVKSHQKISDTAGGFTGILDDNDFFGHSISRLGDFDQDGIIDIAVGAQADDDGGDHRGAVWLLFLNPDGTVKSHQKISDTRGGFTGGLNDGDDFGQSIANLGDLDGDGTIDLAVGAEFDNDGGTGRGALWLLFLNSDGTVKSHKKISDMTSGFSGQLNNWDQFGQDVANLGDLNNDGVIDIIVAADEDDDGGSNRGAAYVFFLEGSGGNSGNTAPVLIPIGAKNVTEDQMLTFSISARDDDGDPVSLTATGLPTGADFVDRGNSSGDFTWTPAVGTSANSPYAVTFTATDSNNAIDRETISITVNPITVGGDTFQQDGGTQGIVSVEAENNHNNVAQGGHEWINVSVTGHSGTGAMRALPDDSTNRLSDYVTNSPRLDFKINFVKTGTHYIWIRGLGYDTGSDSLHVGLDGQAVASAANFKRFQPKGEYVWSNSGEATFEVTSPGVHTVNVYMRESGFIFDKLVLTKDDGFVPSGIGPAESRR